MIGMAVGTGPDHLEAVMDVLVLIGHIFFCALFLVSAMGHLAQTAGMAGYAKSKGVPQAGLAVLAVLAGSTNM